MLLLLLISIVVGNTLRLSAEPLAERPLAAPPADAPAIARLSAAIRLPTVSTEQAPPSSESLAAFAALLERSFPRVHATLRREVIGGSLLYTWQGSDSVAPAILLAAHQDVVPVESGSERRWTHPPFSGAVAGGFVWGRGTIDDKAALMAILEAVERLLARGHQPRGTVYLAFGHDEERGGTGAAAIARLLKQRGGFIGLALDEGFAVLDGVIGGVTTPVAMIGIAEKGYVSVELTAAGSGGHSSMPTDDNAAARVAGAVSRLAERPFPPRLDGVTGQMLDGIAPYADVKMRVALSNRWLAGPLVRRKLLSSPQTAASIRTTTAPTILQAGTKENVLPQRARAVVNHRILPGDTVAGVLAHDRTAIGDPRVMLRELPGAREPSRPAATSGEAYRLLSSAIRAEFPHAAIAPGLVLGATDGRHYEFVTSNVFRFAPFTMRKDDLSRFHGNDERVAVADYMRAIRFYERLISNASRPPDSSGSDSR